MDKQFLGTLFETSSKSWHFPIISCFLSMHSTYVMLCLFINTLPCYLTHGIRNLVIIISVLQKDLTWQWRPSINYYSMPHKWFYLSTTILWLWSKFRIIFSLEIFLTGSWYKAVRFSLKGWFEEALWRQFSWMDFFSLFWAGRPNFATNINYLNCVTGPHLYFKHKKRSEPGKKQKSKFTKLESEMVLLRTAYSFVFL